MKAVTNNTAFAKEKARSGYKKTKLGWIPEDWNYDVIKGFINQLNGFAFKSDEFNQESKGTRLCRGINITKGNLRFDEKNEMFWVNSNKINVEKYLLEDGDIVISMDGSLVGRNYSIVEKEYLPLLLVQRVARLRTTFKMSQHFLLHWISSSYFLRYVDSVKTSSGIPHISAKDINNFKIAIPPLPEQQKIASILNIWDKAIAAQEQLIAQKQALKKGLMQQLLTGKKRFAGFTEEWEEVRLKDIANFRRGSFPQPYGLAKWYDDDNGMPFVQVYDVADNMRLKTKTKRKISALAQDQSVFVKKGTVVLTIQGSIGRIAITQYDAYVDRTLLIFKDYKLPIDTVFFTYVVELLFEREKQIAPGGTIKTITKEKLSNFKLLLPSIEEQKVISKTLKAFEKEITNLKEVLLSIKKQKQGLMQQLLTGERRVKV